MNIIDECNKIISECSSKRSTSDEAKRIAKKNYPHKRTRLDCLLMIIRRDYRKQQGMTQEKINKLIAIAEQFRNELNN